MPFDPDKYLESKGVTEPSSVPSSTSSFNPDEYLKSKKSGFSVTPPPSDLSSNTEDLLRGVAQGGTLGFADELTGAGQAGLDVIKDPSKFDQLKDLYRKYQQESQGNYKASQERSPYLYGGGQLAGGLGTALATGGAGLAAGAGLGEAIAGGAAVGALGGAGSSEGNLDTTEGTEKVLGDVIQGGAAGATIGGVTNLGGQALTKLQGYAKDSPMIRQLLKAREAGMAGETLGRSPEAVSSGANKITSHVKDITDRFTNAENVLGKQINDTLQNAGNSGVKINLGEEAVDSIKALQDYYGSNPLLKTSPQVRSLVNGLKNLVSSEGVSPQAAADIRDQIIQLGKGQQVPGLQQITDNLQKSIRENLSNNVENLDQLYNAFYGLKRAGSETLLSKGQPPDIANVWSSSLKNPESSVYNSVDDLLSKLTYPGKGQIEANQTLNSLTSGLKEYDQKFPGLLDSLGIDLKTLPQELQSKADDYSVLKQVLKPSNFTSIPKAESLQAANYVGKAQKTLSPVVKMSQTVYEMPKESLKGVADSLNDAGLGSLGSALHRALDDNNNSTKNAILFSIMQNPHARAVLDSMKGSLGGVSSGQ